MAGQVETRQGVIAGCTFATSLVKAYYMEPVESLKEKWAQEGVDVDIDVYLDDFTLAATGKQEKVETDMERATKETTEAIEEELGAKVAQSKTTVTSNKKKTAERLAQRIGKGVKAHSSNTLLGCDLAQGGRWRHRKGRRGKPGQAPLVGAGPGETRKETLASG